MSLRLCFSIDNPISPEDLLTLVLAEPQLKLPQDSPRRRREDSEGLPPIVESHVVTSELDFVITVSAESKNWREITAETTGVSPCVGLDIHYGPKIDDTGFYGLFPYLLKQLEGDALLTYDGAWPLLLRKDGLITIEPDSTYCTDANLRAQLPPPVLEGKIPW